MLLQCLAARGAAAVACRAATVLGSEPRCFAKKAATLPTAAAPPGTPAPSAQDKWKAVQLPEATEAAVPVTTLPGQAFVGDLRSVSGLGLGDGKTTHTSKWLTAGAKSPMDYIQEAEPIKVSGLVVASYGSDDPVLGCPVEYISLKGTTYENPAVCKYTGNKFYSDDWKGGGGHH